MQINSLHYTRELSVSKVLRTHFNIFFKQSVGFNVDKVKIKLIHNLLSTTRERMVVQFHAFLIYAGDRSE